MDGALAEPRVLPSANGFRSDVLAALRRRPRRIAPKYFYDAHGSALFDRICELPEYYPARAELQILQRHAPEMARLLGPGIVLAELGSGSSVKTRLLLDRLQEPRAYVPIDISGEHLQRAAAALQRLYPHLPVQPRCADFLQPLELPLPRGRRGVAFFPGSTIGNLEPAETLRLLRRIRRTVGPGGALLVGVDLKKDPARLERAYNDGAGLTAEFNLNLLGRINRELDGDFDPAGFAHVAFYAAAPGRIEMHLESRRDQIVSVAGQTFSFRCGERLHTENSYKYDAAEFAERAAAAGWTPQRIWLDDEALFSVHYLVA